VLLYFCVFSIFFVNCLNVNINNSFLSHVAYHAFLAACPDFNFITIMLLSYILGNKDALTKKHRHCVDHAYQAPADMCS